MKKKKSLQLELFSQKTQKTIALHATLERIKKEFGENAVFPGGQIPVSPAPKPAKPRTPRKKS